MTWPRNGSPTRALVLGGGGAVGVGWQTGLLIGLHEVGVDMAGAEAIVGTSAGALVGALLSSGREVTDALASLAELGQSIDPDSLAAGDDAFLNAIRQANLETEPRGKRYEQSVAQRRRPARPPQTSTSACSARSMTLPGLQASDAQRSTSTPAIWPSGTKDPAYRCCRRSPPAAPYRCCSRPSPSKAVAI